MTQLPLLFLLMMLCELQAVFKNSAGWKNWIQPFLIFTEFWMNSTNFFLLKQYRFLYKQCQFLKNRSPPNPSNFSKYQQIQPIFKPCCKWDHSLGACLCCRLPMVFLSCCRLCFCFVFLLPVSNPDGSKVLPKPALLSTGSAPRDARSGTTSCCSTWIPSTLWLTARMRCLAVEHRWFRVDGWITEF
jgi:hypothetical protein